MLLATLILAFVVIAAKLYSGAFGLARQLIGGGAVAKALRDKSPDAKERLLTLIYRSNRVDWLVYSDEFLDKALRAGRVRLSWPRRLLLIGFRAPVTISGAAALELIGDGANAYGHHLNGPTAWAALVVTLTAALSATVHLMTAVFRRLIFGVYDSVANDIQPPERGLSEHWAVAKEEGSNLPLYFLGLVYLAVVAFVALYAGLDATTKHAFVGTDVVASPVNWIYLSVVTVSTVGFGDLHAHNTLGQLAVIWQITTGPLLLSWLLAVFLTPGRPIDGPTTPGASLR